MKKRVLPAGAVSVYLLCALALGLLFAFFMFAGCGSTAAVSATPAVLTPEPTMPATPTPSPTPEPTPTPTPTPTPKPTPYDITGNGTVDEADEYLFSLWEDGSIGSLEELDELRVYFDGSLLGEKYYDKFCYTGEESGDGYYRNGWVSYTLTQAEEPMGRRTTRFYLADIYVRDLSCLRTYIAGDPEPTGKIRKYLSDDPLSMAQSADALIAVTGDYMSARTVGLEVRNGVWYRSSIDKDRDIGVLKKDGTLVTIDRRTFKLDAIEAMDPWQVWSFGPGLLTPEGMPKTRFNSSVSNFNPRSAIGYFEPGHYCFFVGEARGVHGSLGFTLEQLSQFFYDLGCTVAYNFDGGATAAMMTRDGMISTQSKTRSSSDIVCLTASPFPAEDGEDAPDPDDMLLPEDDETNPEDRGDN